MDLRLFLHFASLRIRERMEYRGAYFIGILAQIVGWGGDYAVVYLLLSRFNSLNGWTWPEVALLFSLELFTYAVGASFVSSAVVELEQMIVDGSFDSVLVRPLDPLLYLAARKYNVGYVAHILISGAFLVWSLGHIGVKIGVLTVGYLAAAVVGAACLQAAALIALGAIAFLAVRSSHVFGLYFWLKRFLVYPINIYGLGVQLLLTLVVPLAFINFYPASLILGKEGAVGPSALGWLTPLIGPIALFGAHRLFGIAVGKYQGAGG
jgi:ABC-2 type transport system permease protein